MADAAVRLLLEMQGATVPPKASGEQLDALLDDTIDDPQLWGSLASNLANLIRNLDQAKVRLPPEAWRSLRHLRAALESPAPPTPAELIPHLTALKTIANESLAHDTAWRFLMVGRLLERGQQLVFLARHLLGRTAPSEFRLQMLLHFADSLFSYRTIYPGPFQFSSVLTWLFAAPENPRGLRWIAARIEEHLEALPVDLAPRAVAALRATARRLVKNGSLLDVAPLATEPSQVVVFLNESSITLAELNDLLTQIYFIHTEPPK